MSESNDPRSTPDPVEIGKLGGYDPEVHDSVKCPVCGAEVGPGSGRVAHIKEEHGE